ncbi:MAG TPA: TonB-dependent receptor [Sphingobium sp.]
MGGIRRALAAQTAGSPVVMGLALCLAGTATQAKAQNAGNDANAPPVAGDILVTARKRTESVEQVPATIGVVSQETLVAARATNLLDLASVAPGINMSRPGISTEVGIKIRGLGSVSFEPSLHTSIGLFADGIYLPHSREFATSMFDVERIEVIRGTQTALIGHNATLGAINMISRKPGNEFAADFRTSYEFEQGSTEFAGGVDLPIAPNMSVRLAGLIVDDQGWVYNRVTQVHEPHRKDTAVRAVLHWEPDDNLDITAIAQRGLNTYRGSAVEYTETGSPEVLDVLAGRPGVVDTKLDRINAQDSTIKPIDHLRTDRYLLTANLQAGDYTLTSSTGYSNYHENDHEDIDLVPGDYFTRIVKESSRQFSQEVRIASPADRPLNFIGGILYINEKFDNQTVYDLNYPLGPAPGLNLAGSFRTQFAQNTESISVFGQANYKIAEQLRVTLAGRWTREHKDADLSRITLRPGLVSLAVFPPYSPLSVKRTDNDLDYLAGIQYDLSNNAMLYASYGKGTKAGGFALSVTLLDEAGFGTETAKTAEIGVKLQDPNRRWLFNIAAFNTDVDGFQQVLIGGPGIIVNSTDLRSRGVEVEAYWRPVEGLQIRLNNTYADAKDKITGNRAPLAPKWSGSAGLNYRTGLHQDLDLILDGSVDYRSRRSYLPDAAAAPTGAPFTPINVSVAVAKHDDSWELRLIGRNLTNELAVNSGGPAPALPAGQIGISERSRTIALQLRGRF